MLTAPHASKWLSVNGDPDLITYEQGSIPGDPWGDLFFGLLHAKVSRDIRARLIDEGLAIQVPRRGSSWAPDHAAEPSFVRLTDV
eukprot:1012632-Alexandrium_andersonii.AAC.1